MNRAILMGRLVRDPDLKQTANGISVCGFTIAVDRRYKNANGERQTDFIPIVAWRNQADFAGKYFRQGLRVLVSGTIQVRSWEDRDGNKRYTTEVIADELEFADGKKNTDSDNTYTEQRGGYGNSFAQSHSSSSNYSSNQSYYSPKQSSDDDGSGFFPAPDDDTDLPFDL